jgi:hypothetical protein
MIGPRIPAKQERRLEIIYAMVNPPAQRKGYDVARVTAAFRISLGAILPRYKIEQSQDPLTKRDVRIMNTHQEYSKVAR